MAERDGGHRRPNRGRLAPYGLLAPGIIWLTLFFLVPLASLARMSLSSKQSRFDFVPSFSWDWANYSDVFSLYGTQLARSFGFALAATVLCLLIGYPLAYWVAVHGGRWRNVLIGLVVVPFFTSFLLRTISWTVLLADTPLAVIGGLTYNFLPFMILPIYVSLEKIDLRLLDAAADLYASGTSTLRRVVFPLSLPGVFAGSLLTFIPASGDFVNAAVLGGTRSRMIGNVVQDRFLVQLDYPGAAAISLLMMAIITSAVLLYAKLLGTAELA